MRRRPRATNGYLALVSIRKWGWEAHHVQFDHHFRHYGEIHRSSQVSVVDIYMIPSLVCVYTASLAARVWVLFVVRGIDLEDTGIILHPQAICFS